MALGILVRVFIPVLKLGFLIRERAGMRYWFSRVYNDQTPPTGLIGPVTDMARFMIAYLSGGEPILQPETTSTLKGAIEMLSRPGESVQGLGWRAHRQRMAVAISPTVAGDPVSPPS